MPVLPLEEGLFSCSEFGAPRRSCEGNYVADVWYASDEHQHSLEAEAEAGVRNGAVTAKIEIPFVVGGVHVVSAHVVLQDIYPLFALAAVDDFANSLHEEVHFGFLLLSIVQ